MKNSLFLFSLFVCCSLLLNCSPEATTEEVQKAFYEPQLYLSYLETTKEDRSNAKGIENLINKTNTDFDYLMNLVGFKIGPIPVCPENEKCGNDFLEGIVALNLKDIGISVHDTKDNLIAELANTPYYNDPKNNIKAYHFTTYNDKYKGTIILKISKTTIEGNEIYYSIKSEL